MRHNEVRDLVANVMRETCHNTATEPQLLPLSGERFRSSTANSANDARVDIKANGFWSSSRHECAYFDVRIFFPVCTLIAACRSIASTTTMNDKKELSTRNGFVR